MWTHKKYKKNFFGAYVRSNGERIFQIYGTLKDGTVKIMNFESWQAAKRAGWERV